MSDTSSTAPRPTAEDGGTASSSVRWERGADGIVTLVLDAPDQAANTMNAAFAASFRAAVDRLEAERDGVRGVVITSAKKTFFAGGDLNELIQAGPDDARRVFDTSMAIKRDLRRLETLGRPVVAALNGAALGGGYEIALACHHRVALDAPGSRIGLPEVTLGLLPGCGGVTRTVRLLGITDALLNVLLQGQRHRPARALELGLVDQLVTSEEELLGAARAFVDANPDAAQPWDREGYRIPGGTPASRAFAAQLPAFPATLREQTAGAPLPAPRSIMAAAVEGAQVDLDNAQLIESRYFTELAIGQTASNMIQAFFFDLQAVNAGAGRPRGEPERHTTTVGVVGAGMMGAGIAYSCARAGLRVILQDVSVEAAERGKEYAAGVLAKALAKGRTTKRQRDASLARVVPTDRTADLADCDVVIEAVYEDTALKQRVFREIQEVVAPGTLLCTNTSTLPVTDLAGAVSRPEDFLGLHFFSPVDRMPLVEIVRGRATGDGALAHAFDLVRQLDKTPIVVQDARGFFTSRVISHFLNEGIGMLAEGVDPASVEQAAAQAGYPARVLSLVDELTLTLPRQIRGQAREAVEAAGGTWEEHPAERIIDRMVEEFGRTGRSGGAGFYDYGEDGRRQRLWPGLREHFGGPAGAVSDLALSEMAERMMFVQSLDTVRLVEEGVLTSVAEANIGSLLGIGFPPWTGGVLQYVNGYPGGPAGFVARARELRDRWGPRFEPPALLVAKATAGERFTDEPRSSPAT